MSGLLPHWYAELEKRTTQGVKLGLDRMQALLARAGNPERQFKSLLIAGTNGKGSVAAMWAGGLQAAGFRVGLYTSPHLIHFTERIQVDGAEIQWPTLDRLMARLERLELELGERLTFFEVATWFALEWFAEQRVDVAVLEVGMGGRLDATNAVEPVLSIVTSIGLDHTEHLGHTLAEVAGEKAGIFRADVPAVVGEMPDEALQALRLRAEVVGARFVELKGRYGDDGWVEWAGRRIEGLEPRLGGSHQRRNAALFALSALVDQQFSLNDVAIARGAQAKWPGRFEKLALGGRLVVLDGAHNHDGVLALRAAITEADLPRPRTLVFGVVKGEGKAGLLPVIADLFDQVFVVAPPSARAMPAAEAAVPGATPIEDWCEGLKTAIDATAEGGSLVIAGSLYLVGAARGWLLHDPADGLADFR